MTATPWILITQEPMGLWCQRCGVRQPFAEGVPIEAFQATGDAFVAAHAACEPAPAAHEVRRAGGLELPGFGEEGQAG